MPSLLPRGPERWGLSRCPCPRRGAELERAGRKPAGSSEESLVLGAEDWDFVGQLNRHLHLARKDPALSSRVSRLVVRGAGSSRTGTLGLGPAARFPQRTAQPTLWVFPKRRPLKWAPAPQNLSPGRVTRCSKLSVWGLPGHP